MITSLDLLHAANNAYYTTSTLVAAGDVHVVLSEIEDTTIVAFRGTKPNDIEDWFRDFSAWPHEDKEFPGLGYCHTGFLTGAVAIFPDLKKLVEGKKFILVGHSLGGALAVATAGLFRIGLITPDRLETFGAPSVGFNDLTKLTSPIPGNRWVDSDDPVPSLLLYYQDRIATRIGHPRLNPIHSHLIDIGYMPDLIAYYRNIPNAHI